MKRKEKGIQYLESRHLVTFQIMGYEEERT